MFDASRFASASKSANQGWPGVAGLGDLDLLLGAVGMIFDALKFATTFSIVPFSNPIEAADARKLASSFLFLISILPLIWAKPVIGCVVSAVNRARSSAAAVISRVPVLRPNCSIRSGN